MEAMEHAYFHPVVSPLHILSSLTPSMACHAARQVREHGRASNISGSSPTAGALGAAIPAQVGGAGPAPLPQVPSSPILSPNNTPLPAPALP